MHKNNRILNDVPIVDQIIESDEARISDMSPVEIAEELEQAGLTAARLVDRVAISTNAMRKNAMIAERMHIDRSSIRRRSVLLLIMAFLGFGVSVSAVIGASVSDGSISEPGRQFLALLLTGGVGLTLISLLGTLYVLWNAYVHKSILAEVAREETRELASTIDTICEDSPKITASQLYVLLRQNPAFVRHRHPRDPEAA